MRIVLDTNVVASGIFWGGKPLEVLRAWRDGHFEVVASPEILWEYEQTLIRMGKGEITAPLQYWLDLLHDRVNLVQPGRLVKICRDPDDDKFLSCALQVRASCIVSGDKDLLTLGVVEGIEILNPAKFIGKYLGKKR